MLRTTLNFDAKDFSTYKFWPNNSTLTGDSLCLHHSLPPARLRLRVGLRRHRALAPPPASGPAPRRVVACLSIRRTLPGSWPAQGGLAPPAGAPRGRALTPAARCSTAARIRQAPASAHRLPPGHPDACGYCTRTASGRGRGHQPQQATSHSRFRHLPSTILQSTMLFHLNLASEFRHHVIN